MSFRKLMPALVAVAALTVSAPARGAELADTLDEDYELEISEPALSLEIRKISSTALSERLGLMASRMRLVKLAKASRNASARGVDAAFHEPARHQHLEP